MKLSSLEKRILKYILEQYPDTAHYAADDKYPLADECPLPTTQKIGEAHPDATAEQVNAAVTRLVSLKLVQDIYLYTSSEVVRAKGGAGKGVKIPLAIDGSGPTGYQATAFGETTRNDFWDKWLKEQGTKFAESLAKEYGAKILAALGGFGLAVLLAAFGVDMRAWFTKAPAEPAPMTDTKPAEPAPK